MQSNTGNYFLAESVRLEHLLGKLMTLGTMAAAYIEHGK
jgi:hypothetical protein